MEAAVQIHAAEHDDYFTPEAAEAMAAQLQGLGIDVTLFAYPGAGHAFFNEDRPEAYHEESAGLLWDRTLAFFRQTLG
jgi:carboxymethylenebutenolidase